MWVSGWRIRRVLKSEREVYKLIKQREGKLILEQEEHDPLHPGFIWDSSKWVQKIWNLHDMRRHTTMRNPLIHPMDKVNIYSLEETAICVYRSRIKMSERQNVVLESDWRNIRKKYNCRKGRSTKRQSQSEQNKSVITDHVNTLHRQSGYELGWYDYHRPWVRQDGGSGRPSRSDKKVKT